MVLLISVLVFITGIEMLKISMREAEASPTRLR
jgi:hypothetical protein